MQKIRQDCLKNAKICDRHFTPDDFQRNIQAGRIGRSFSLKLFLLSSSLITLLNVSKSFRQVRQEARERRKL
ncbi:Hypothetical protein FKW44_016650 [Caligus rogercresseyi]|uniref:Uncharacterized protein n=1 Tax=Caligus rogercresseyi TaxID=217165 RepID=A0A7T8H246_CALRO|nr:Hypothetical protein FKW44_016650 [Caligus rogercresseyi]